MTTKASLGEMVEKPHAHSSQEPACDPSTQKRGTRMREQKLSALTNEQLLKQLLQWFGGLPLAPEGNPEVASTLLLGKRGKHK